MKNLKSLTVFFAVVILSACSKVPAGNVGIKFYLLGGDKGVDYEELGPGRYWIGVNEELYLFPTFTQNYVWTAGETEGSEGDESFTFQDNQGLSLNADIGITYSIDPQQVDRIFQTYKRGIDEITDVFLRNMVRDALVSIASQYDVEYLYGKGRASVLDEVSAKVKASVEPLGIMIDKIYWVGGIRLPKVVKEAIDNKIRATQIAQQRENELREAEAAAKKKVAEAQGQAESIALRAKAEAEANLIVARSLTPELVEYEKVKKWDGKQPNVVGASGVIMQMGN